LLKNISFSKLLTELPEKDFCQINKKEIIAVKTITFFSHNEINSSITKDGKQMQFSLSEIYKANFLKRTSP
jgi:hypothetical protein